MEEDAHRTSENDYTGIYDPSAIVPCPLLASYIASLVPRSLGAVGNLNDLLRHIPGKWSRRHSSSITEADRIVGA
jgi:hypothetical protein